MINTGIYAIVHETSARRYVGQAAVSFTHRHGAHHRALKNNRHHSPKLQHLYNKHGKTALKFVVLERIDIRGKTKAAVRLLMRKREQHHMDKTPKELLLNCSPSATSTLGLKFTGKAIATIQKRYNLKWRADNLAHLSKLNATLAADPKWRAKMKDVWAKTRRRTNDPKERAKMGAIMRKLWADPKLRTKFHSPKWRVNNLAHLARLNAKNKKALS